MGKDLIISANRHETKVAIMEDEELVEIFYQRANEYSLVGSIHKGKATRVLPGMQSAFVDIGLERDAFLYVSDFFEDSEEYEQLPGDDDKASSSRAKAVAPAVEEAEAESRERPRRGRRSRRRRSKGRGFPESKYAAATGEEAKEEEPKAQEARETRESRESRDSRDSRERRPPRESRRTREEPEKEQEDSGAEEFLLLPGESLAKYSRGASKADTPDDKPVAPEKEPDSPGLDELNAATESDEPEATPEGMKPEESPEAEATAEVEDHSLQAKESEATASEEDADGENLEAATPEKESAKDSDSPGAKLEPEPEPEAEVLPEVGAADTETETETTQDEPRAAASGEAADEEAEDRSPESSDEVAQDESVPAKEVVPERSSRSSRGRRGRRGRGRKPESEDDEIKAMILGQLDDTVKAELAAEAEKENAEEAGKSHGKGSAADRAPENKGEDDGDETDDSPVEGSASVRDQEHRYPQRAPRRGRRRGRSGRGDSKQDNDARGGDGASKPAEQAEASSASGEPAEDKGAERESRESRGKADKGPLPLISDLLKEGQEILVQIAKEPMGQKGARITSHIALPGRYVVYMPTLDHLGVSRKIGSDKERQRLRKCLQSHRDGIPGGFIMRTAGEGRSDEEIAQDMKYLFNLWVDIRERSEKRRAPALLHHDLQVVERVLRDQMTDDFTTVWVDQEDAYEGILRFLERFQPKMVKRVRLYSRSAPIFDAFNITQELEKAIRPKVWLKSGGYIVINQTEALVAIDINTGKYVGRSNRLEDTIVKTNIEAVREIVRQMRLRDLGGIIVIDFIDMEERKNRHKVMQALESAMRVDRAPSKVLQFNDFGLVAITRRRVKQSLERTLCMPCPYCEGAAYVKSVDTVIGEILTEAHKLASAVEGEDFVLRVHPDVAQVLKNSKNQYLEELEEILGRPVLVTADGLLHHEKFDLA